MKTLSQYLLRRILLELDVASLVRCTRISKSWLRFISTDRVIWETKHLEYFSRFTISFEPQLSSTAESQQSPEVTIDRLQQNLLRNLLCSTSGVYATDKLKLLLIPSKKKGQQTRGRFLLRWMLVDGCSRSTYCYAFLWSGHFHSVPDSPSLGYVGARYVGHSLLNFDVEYAGGDYAWFDYSKLRITTRNRAAMKPTSWTFKGRFEPLIVEVNDKRSVGAMKLVLEHLDGIPLVGDTTYEPEFLDQMPLIQQQLQLSDINERYTYHSDLRRETSSETDELLNSSNPTVKRFFSEFDSLPSSLLLPRFESYLIELYHLVRSELKEGCAGFDGSPLRNFDYFDLDGTALSVSWVHPSSEEIKQLRSLRGFLEHSFDELWRQAKKVSV